MSRIFFKLHHDEFYLVVLHFNNLHLILRIFLPDFVIINYHRKSVEIIVPYYCILNLQFYSSIS